MEDTYLRLLNRIKNQPLTFPTNVKVDPELKELLSRMVTIDEDQRISWDEIFLHPLLNDDVPEYFAALKNCDLHVEAAMKEIRERPKEKGE